MSATRIPALMYHRIGDHCSPWDARYSVTPGMFARQMAKLAGHGYQACSLADFLAWHAQGRTLPDKSLLITFDDGFCGVHDHALPVLRELGWAFTVFMVSDKMGAPADWSRSTGPGDRSHHLMNQRELEALLDAGASIQSHTATHIDLTTLTDAALSQELTRSRAALTALTGTPVRAIAYPFGRHDQRVIALARQAGYEAGFSVVPGFNRPATAPMELRRLDVFGADSAAGLLRKVRFGSNDGSLGQNLRYLAGRLSDRLRPTGKSPAP